MSAAAQATLSALPDAMRHSSESPRRTIVRASAHGRRYVKPALAELSATLTAQFNGGVGDANTGS